MTRGPEAREIVPPRGAGIPKARLVWGAPLAWVIASAALIGFAYALARRSALGTDILFFVFLWGGAGVAWAIHSGPAGRLSLGHAAYFGLGAYTAAMFQTSSALPIWLAFPVGMAVAAAAGAALELVTGRLQGLYYALATFAFAQLVWLIGRNWREVTKGTEGITVPFDATRGLRGLMFENSAAYVPLAGVAAAVCLGAFVLISRGRLGYFVRALRDAPDAARAIGLAANRWRAATAAMSAGLTAMIGIVFTQHVLFVDPDTVLSFRISTQVMLPAIVGGLNVAYGAMLGSAFMVPLRAWLLSADIAGSAALVWIIYGAALALIVLLVPEGLVSLVERPLRRLGRRR